ncbi:MAG: YggS family pyridoxal phosphate-dependent enzyme [Alphaproteobacteria bacterium]|nr:MAG: YggS family pyridoxal phosphate-dependent enzyme [Alphaproteobacteria bacterium]
MNTASIAIADALATLEAEIAAAAAVAGRPRAAITLTAVSKTQPVARLEEALAAGLRTFGENRVQEAEARWPALRSHHSDLHLRLIGPLQTNKAADAVALFDVIETVDRDRLAIAIAKEQQRQGRQIGCLIQVNTGEEPQKAGILPAEADAFIDRCRGEHGLTIRGLMCIPPADQPAAPHFAFLAEMARRHGLPELSMGMSADFATAIRLGATHIRIGSALFGARG